jgi:DNA-binding transcriptional MerR regulator
MIPNKSNFKFQELTPLTGVKPYVIRFWETEFEEISPVTSDSGQRLYARKDVEAIMKIKHLLFDEKLSIQEAKLAIKQRKIELELTDTDNGLDTELEKAIPNPREIILDALKMIREIKSSHRWS